MVFITVKIVIIHINNVFLVGTYGLNKSTMSHCRTSRNRPVDSMPRSKLHYWLLSCAFWRVLGSRRWKNSISDAKLSWNTTNLHCCLRITSEKPGCLKTYPILSHTTPSVTLWSMEIPLFLKVYRILQWLILQPCLIARRYKVCIGPQTSVHCLPSGYVKIAN